MGDLARRPHRLGAAKYQLPAPEKLDGPEVLVDLGGDRCGDTTVVKANVEYPTDPGLLAKDVVKMAEKIKRIKGRGWLPAPSADTASSTTTWSRSPGSSPEHRGPNPDPPPLLSNRR